MAEYKVNHRYRSNRDGKTFGPYEPDTNVDLEEADADWVNRDSPGCLTALEATAKADGEAPPAKDRAHKGGRTR
jgi:hypothetical protein